MLNEKVDVQIVILWFKVNIFAFNAAGEDVPLLSSIRGDIQWAPIYNMEEVSDALCGKFPTGYMDSEVFRKWFVRHFLKFTA